jgi:UDP-N-acetylmuramoyl-L-alanyl-D-glutamate--2,6-diaminopimelate ligase
MRFRALISPLEGRRSGGDADPEVTGLAWDSRRVRPGDLFVALKGARQDGHDHLAEALRAGAVALVTETDPPGDVPGWVTPSTWAALSPLAARFHGRPSEKIPVLGVTGTNGKTTITYMLEHILKRAGKVPGVIGTIDYRWPGHLEKAPNTTPLAAEVQRLLAEMVSAGVTHAVMESSSHALALGRVADVRLSIGVFTNLTQDHLDFHKDMETYFEAKARLFSLLDRSPSATAAVINTDDPWGEKLSRRVKTRRVSYGVAKPAEVMARDVTLGPDGSRFLLRTPAGERPCVLPLVGRHNVYNALAAVGSALAWGVPLETVLEALARLPGAPGRLERIEGAGFSVFVDYAHTEDALRNVLGALRPLAGGKLIALFGCGGDRDRAKRPLMGAAAAALADHVIVTSDNPRSEDPAAIALDVEVGLRRSGAKNYEVILDRGEAIARALGMARPGDIVLLAGKGHETYQILKDRTIDFDDRERVRAALKAMGSPA